MNAETSTISFLDVATYRPVGRIVVRSIGSDTLLVPVSGPVAGGRVYPMNKTAELVWSSLIAGGTVRQTVAALVARYVVTETQARTDCEECVSFFLNEALIDPV